MRPHLLSYLLLTLALSFFAIAQVLPAILPDMGAWNAPDKTAVAGVVITVLAWPFYLSNGALLLAPLLVFLFKRLKMARLALGILIAFYILTPFATLAFTEAILDVAAGFYFWVASYWTAALGAAFALPPKEQAREATGRERIAAPPH